MARKGFVEGIQENLPYLGEPCPIFLLTNANKIPRGTTTDVSISPPGFMLQMDFSFFNVEKIRGFTSTFVDICSATSYPFGFPPRRKRAPFDIFRKIVIKLSNQDEKVAFIRIGEYVALSGSFDSMNK